MDTLHNGGTVVSIRGNTVARRELAELVTVAQLELDAVVAGDVDSVFAAHRAISRAVVVVLDNRLSTSFCWRCGAQVAAGRCCGCGSPPERAS